MTTDFSKHSRKNQGEEPRQENRPDHKTHASGRQHQPSSLLAQYERDGVLGPFTLCSPEEMVDIRERIETRVLANDSPFDFHNGQSRHLDCKTVWDLCSHPNIVALMASLMGPNLQLWRSNFFTKEPGSKEIPWHQDRAYWPIEPMINITAWLAIDPATTENSCLQFIPGSHKNVLPVIESDDGMGATFEQMADVNEIDLSTCIDMEMKPGEFCLFNETTVHRSAPNLSNKRRLALSIRVTTPEVKVRHEEIFPGHKCIQLCGENPEGRNEMQSPPLQDPLPQKISYQNLERRPPN